MKSKYARDEIFAMNPIQEIAHPWDIIRAIQKEAFHAGATQNGELTVDKKRLNHIWLSFCARNPPNG